MGSREPVRRSARLEQFVQKVGPELFARACAYHRARAPETGLLCQRDNYPAEDNELWNVADDLSDWAVEMEGVETADRVRLLFELYREMPSYWVLEKVEWLAKSLTESDWAVAWECFRSALSNESPEQADPAGYALWCGAFEDDDLAPRAWRALATEDASDRMMERLLKLSGPVPWEAKVKTYRRLARDRRWHPNLAEALRLCYADSYGRNNAKEALVLYSMLQLAPNTATAQNLIAVVADLKRGIAHYRDKGGTSHGA